VDLLLLDLRSHFPSPVPADATVLFGLDSRPRGFFLSLVHQFPLLLVCFCRWCCAEVSQVRWSAHPASSYVSHDPFLVGCGSGLRFSQVFSFCLFNPTRTKSRSKAFIFWILSSCCGCRRFVAVHRPAHRFSCALDFTLSFRFRSSWAVFGQRSGASPCSRAGPVSS
jgi:hypothetical protein